MGINVEIIYAGFSILPGLAIFLFMTMSVIQFRNRFLLLFYIAYTGVGILSLVYLIQLVLFYSRRVQLINRTNIFEVIGIVLLVEGLSLLIIEIFFEEKSLLIKLFVFLIGFAPIFLYIITIFSNLLEFDIFFQICYFLLYGVLTFDCFIFVINFRKVGNVNSRNLGLSFAILLFVFLVLFVFERFISFINILFNPMPAFFLMWNLLLIFYIWKTILKGGLGKLFEIQKDFSEKYGLSSREEEIVQLVIEGNKNSAIAEKLVISEKTETNHIYNIYKKLEINSRFELICLYKD